MRKIKTILSVVIVLVLICCSIAFATDADNNPTRFNVSVPTLTANGGTVSCGARIRAASASIDATLELYKGSTLVAWWNKTGTGNVSFNETAPFTSGQSYTLTISGTVDGVAFTPQSTTQTLW